MKKRVKLFIKRVGTRTDSTDKKQFTTKFYFINKFKLDSHDPENIVMNRCLEMFEVNHKSAVWVAAGFLRKARVGFLKDYRVSSVYNVHRAYTFNFDWSKGTQDEYPDF